MYVGGRVAFSPFSCWPYPITVLYPGKKGRGRKRGKVSLNRVEKNPEIFLTKQKNCSRDFVFK